MKVIWKEPARRRLDDLYEFIAGGNPRAAAKIYNDIVDETALLSEFPQMAAVEPLLGRMDKIFRSLVVARAYKVVYYIDEAANEIAVIEVWDCRQDPSKLRKNVLKKRTAKK